MIFSRKAFAGGWGARTLLFGILGIILAGCYVSEREIIGASRAVAVPGLPGDYSNDDGTTTSVVAVAYSNDYRFRRVSKDGDVSTGTVRAVPLRGDIYLTQIKYDDEAEYALLFYEFVAGDEVRFSSMEADVEFDVLERLARDYGVSLEYDEFLDDDYVVGDPGPVLDFLLAHRDLPMKYDGY